MNKLETYVQAYRKLTNRVINENARLAIGKLPSADYFELKNRLSEFNLLCSHDDSQHYVEIHLPIETDRQAFINIGDLLSAPQRHLQAPAVFHVADLDYLHNEGGSIEPPELITQYLNTVKLASAFINIADHVIKDYSPKAIFLLGEKLELSLKYGKDDLKPLDGLDRFIENFINADIHKDQKAAIIKKVLLEMLSNNKINSLTLPCVINRFEEFLDRVSANYQLYVSEFSFEKIKAQVEQEKFDLTLKLNKVFSDIQNQLLAVPITLIVAGSQMTNMGEFTAKNFFIWVGSLIFGAFMFLLIRNQGNTLQAIEAEIDFQWNLIKSKHAAAQGRLKNNYKKLETRCEAQHKTLKIVQGIVLSSIAAVTLLFLYFSGLVDPSTICILKNLTF